MKLHIIRHAKAAAPRGEFDIDRPLSEKGIKQAIALSNYLQNKLINCSVICSEAKRTRETLKYISEKVDFKSVAHRIDFYLCEKEVIMNELWKNESQQELVIVGHNFGISDLVNYFTDELLQMQTGEYICIDFGELSLQECSKSTGTIVDRFRM